MKPGKRVSAYSYLYQVFVYIPILLFSLATLVGCQHYGLTAMRVKDSLPTDSAKGYVEFYYLKTEGFREANIRNVRVQIYSFENNKKVREEETGSDTSWAGPKVGLRVAKLPGTYNYALCLGTAEKVVTVAVEQGKVTPVRIQFGNINLGVGQATFSMAVTVEEAMPIAAYELASVPSAEKSTASVSTAVTSGGPKESDIARGLTMVSDRQYTKAASLLVSGFKWLKSDPSYKATTDSLVSKEAEYIGKLIEQIRGADQKGVFGSSDPMAKVVEKAIEAQAKVIKSIDDRRRSQLGATSSPNAKEKSPRTLPETKTKSTLAAGSGSGRGVEPKIETGTESLRRALASARGVQPRPATGSGSMRGVLKDKDTGTPVQNATIAMLKVKSVEGGKATIEFGISPDGKMVGGMSTKTDDAGAFRFAEVVKGAPYVLGAVDQSGKNIVVILK